MESDTGVDPRFLDSYGFNFTKWVGGGWVSIWLLYLLYFPDFFENSPWNLNNFDLKGSRANPVDPLLGYCLLLQH